MMRSLTAESFAAALADLESRPVSLSRDELYRRRRDVHLGGELNRLQGERPHPLVERLDQLFAHGQASRDEVIALTREAYRLGLLDQECAAGHER